MGEVFGWASGLPVILMVFVWLFLLVWLLALMLLPLMVLSIQSKNAAILKELRRLNAAVDSGIGIYVTPKKQEQE
ncbi:MAG: hypothetical protein ABJM39_11785 [Porticoccus sp.]|uniref:hypothetical protein n=1 Tax=Porticoccus sp. TaxID=2024853 RepID=UPI00328C28F5